MITLSVIVTEKYGTASCVATFDDSGATPLEKAYLLSISDSLGRPNNPLHLLASENAEKYRTEDKKASR